MLLTFSHLSLFQRILEVFSCRVSPNQSPIERPVLTWTDWVVCVFAQTLVGNQRVLRFATDFNCDTPEHESLKNAAKAFGLVWSLFLPMLLFCYLLHLRTVDRLNQFTSRARFGYLILKYTAATW